MSILYEIDKQMEATFVVWDRRVSAQDFLNHANRLSSDANWPPPARLHLSDLRRASLDASMHEANLAQAASIYGRQPDKLVNMKVAIVASHEFERAVAFERLMERYGPRVIVFNQLETACSWLGIDVNEVGPRLFQLWATSHGTAG